MEYELSFLIARRVFNAINCTMLLSGALSIFKRDILISAGGFRVRTVGEDMEVVVRLQRLIARGVKGRKRSAIYRISYTPNAVCYTSVPSSPNALFRQRIRWHMGLLEVMWIHRRMLFNPKYLRCGMIAMPYLLINELLSPLTTLFGVLIIKILYKFEVISLLGILIPFLATLIFYEVLALITYRLHTKHFKKKERIGGVLISLALGLISIFLYRPWLNIAKLKAMFGYRKYKGKWLRSR